MPIVFVPGRQRRRTAGIKKDAIVLPERTVKACKWQTGQQIELSYILSPAIVFMTRYVPPSDEDMIDHYTLLPTSGDRGATGAMLKCGKFIDDILREKMRLPLPINSVQTVEITCKSVRYAVLLIHEPDWSEVDFSSAGIRSISPDAVGIYRLRNAENQIERIGKGKLRDQIGGYLRDPDYMRDICRAQYTYFATSEFDKAGVENAELMEQVYQEIFVRKHGKLPEKNPIRR